MRTESKTPTESHPTPSGRKSAKSHRTQQGSKKNQNAKQPKKPKKSKSGKKPRRKTAVPAGRVEFASHGFVKLFIARVGGEALLGLDRIRRHAAGAPARELSRAELIIALVFHCTTHLAGGLAEHLMMLGITMSASSLSERRQATPWEVFVEVMRLMLKPLAREGQQVGAFYQGLLLVALDATEFSLLNTEDILEKVKKQRSRRGKAAFAKLRCSVLVELFNHNPLAVKIGREQESEWELSLGLLESLPPKALLLGDRLYGCGAFVLRLAETLKVRQGHFLLRVRQEIKSMEVIEHLCDGSRIVEVTVRNKQSQVLGKVIVREIEARVQRAGSVGVKMRLWTSLLDAKKAPARELVDLYVKRWEHELYFRELKHQMMTGDLLKSQTLETACQEVAAMILGTSLLAEERMKLEEGEELERRVSLLKTWQYMETVWVVLMAGGDLLSVKQKEAMAERIRGILRRMLTPKRRSRSCPRAVRQPVRGWPRKRSQRSFEGPLQISLRGKQAR